MYPGQQELLEEEKEHSPNIVGYESPNSAVKFKNIKIGNASNNTKPFKAATKKNKNFNQNKGMMGTLGI